MDLRGWRLRLSVLKMWGERKADNHDEEAKEYKGSEAVDRGGDNDDDVKYTHEGERERERESFYCVFFLTCWNLEASKTNEETSVTRPILTKLSKYPHCKQSWVQAHRSKPIWLRSLMQARPKVDQPDIGVWPASEQNLISF